VSVSNGQDANQTTFNSAFISRTQDSDTIGKVGLNNTSDVNSGAQIVNTQRLINEVRDATGVAGEGDTSSKTYSSANYVADGDDRKVAIGKLDAGLAAAAADATAALNESTSLRNLTGTGTGTEDLGTFDGSTITVDTTIRQALQDLETAVETKLDASEKGAASGVCPLDGTSKIPSAYLPSTLQELKGNWDASTNSPTLVDGTGDVGDTYRVSVAGTQNLGSGSVTYEVGDWIYYASGVWYKLDATDAVTSVQGLQGAVSLDSDDIPEGSTNEYWTNAKFDTRLGTKSIDALSDVDTTTVTPSISDVLTYDGVKWAPAAPASGAPDVSTATGTLAINHGGTGQTTAAAAVDALLPTQSGNAGKVLGTNGTTHSWVAKPSPHLTVYKTGSGTHNVNAATIWMEVEMVGGGGSGGGGGNNGTAGNGSAGNSTTFGSFTAGGGGGGKAGGAGVGGGGTNSASVNGYEFVGGQGGGGGFSTTNASRHPGGHGGYTRFGMGGAGAYNQAGSNGQANTGAGGGGGGSEGNSTGVSGSGGGGGGYVYEIIASPSSSYSYSVAAAQTTVGTAGTSGFAGGTGAEGIIIIREWY